jgi:hypothetical protein
MARFPRTLTRRRAQLAFEKLQLDKRLSRIDFELNAIDFALHLISPTWVPPMRVKRVLKPAQLGRGAIASSCLGVLRRDGELNTNQIAGQIAEERRITFATKVERKDFSSAVAMALRRYERKGVVMVIGGHGRRLLTWRLRQDSRGRMALVHSA